MQNLVITTTFCGNSCTPDQLLKDVISKIRQIVDWKYPTSIASNTTICFNK